MKDFLQNLKFAWKYAKGQKRNLICYAIFNFLSIIISIIVPILSAKIIVELTNREFYQVLIISAIILLVDFFSNISNYFTRFFLRQFTEKHSLKSKVA